MKGNRYSKGYVISVITLLALVSVSGILSGCQPPGDNDEVKHFVYAVKFVCSPEVGPPELDQLEAPFEPANYRTVVNVHNFRNDDIVGFTKKVVLARSEDIDRGMISQKIHERLRPDEALAIDCLDILDLFGGQQPIGDGFVVIESKVELDVVAVYTALPLDKLQGVSMDVEYIQPKVVIDSQPPGSPDLVPVRRPGSVGAEGFCNLDEQGKLIVTVRNQGSADAGASTTRVRFFTSGGEVDVNLATPALPFGGGPVELTPHVEIPAGCYSPDCNFEITVDVNNDVGESNEANNAADGFCLG